MSQGEQHHRAAAEHPGDGRGPASEEAYRAPKQPAGADAACRLDRGRQSRDDSNPVRTASIPGRRGRQVAQGRRLTTRVLFARRADLSPREQVRGAYRVAGWLPQSGGPPSDSDVFVTCLRPVPLGRTV
jgi:hypothetical protein